MVGVIFVIWLYCCVVSLKFSMSRFQFEKYSFIYLNLLYLFDNILLIFYFFLFLEKIQKFIIL